MADKECRIDVASQPEIQQSDGKYNNLLKGLLMMVEKIKGDKSGPQPGDQDSKSYSTKKIIHRVPATMGGKSEFMPQKFSIGPIHVYNEDLRANTVLKIKLAIKFIKGSGKDTASLFGEVRNKIDHLKRCFDERVITRFDHLRTKEIKEDPVINKTVIERFDDELLMMLDEPLIKIFEDHDGNLDDPLARLLFVDGCAVLQFIHSFQYNPDELKELKINNDEATLIQQDLFFMENQIPYSLLRLLIGVLRSEGKKREYIRAIFALVHNNNVLAWPIGNNYRNYGLKGECKRFIEHHNLGSDEPEESDLPKHLLDFLRSIIFGNHDGVPVPDDKCKMESKDEDRGCLSCIPFFGKSSPENSASEDEKELWENMSHDDKRSFRNVQELKSAWIKLKPADDPYLTSVSFRSISKIRGHLRIPSLIADNWTRGKVLNLVAYEKCLGNKKEDYVITSYLKLMDLLIDSEKDVEELRKASIVRHYLISDKHVAELFNSLGPNCWLRPDQDMFLNVTRDIDKHCHRHRAKWAAQFYNDHCTSPVAFLTCILAIVAGLITINSFLNTFFPKESAPINSIANFYDSA